LFHAAHAFFFFFSSFTHFMLLFRYARKQWALVLKAFATVSDKAVARFQTERESDNDVESSDAGQVNQDSAANQNQNVPDEGEGQEDSSMHAGMHAMKIDDTHGDGTPLSAAAVNGEAPPSSSAELGGAGRGRGAGGRGGRSGGARKRSSGSGARPDLFRAGRPELRASWTQFRTMVARLAAQVKQAEKSFAFAFVEGVLIKVLSTPPFHTPQKHANTHAH
jgi:hypothetical protein